MKQRLLSLDVLRGITVFGMIVVNNAGGEYSYDSLQHSVWNGLTPCDLVFPFFLFIMGISTYIALRKFQFQPSAAVIRKIVRRTVLIFLIGWGIYWFEFACEGDFFPFAHIRILGVLPRIALCYGIVSLLALYVRPKGLAWIAGFLLLGYAFLLHFGNGYAQDAGVNILAVWDTNVLGYEHLYHKSPVDPEGLTSTLSAIAHTIIGFLCGRLIMETKDLNQKIMAMLQAALLYFIDAQGRKEWCRFFEVFGVNPLFLYVLSELTAVVLNVTEWKPVLYGGIHSVISNPYLASAVYSLLFVGVMGAIGYPLYKKKIYIKI